MLPLSSFAESSLFNLNNPRISLLTVSVLDIAAHPEAMEQLISDEILSPPPMPDLPLPTINDTYHPILFLN